MALTGCWSKNFTNSHLIPGPFTSRVMHSCLGLQCLHSPNWSRHERRIANCDGFLRSTQGTAIRAIYPNETFESNFLHKCFNLFQHVSTPQMFQFGKQQSRHKNISSSIVLYTSGQPSYSRRHSSCWVSPHGNTLSLRAVTWTQGICSTQPSPVHLLGMHSTSNRETRLCPLHNSYSSTDNNRAVWRSGMITDGMRGC